MNDTTPIFSFIIVNFRSRAPLTRCLFTLARATKKLPHDVIIVNNDAEPLIAPHTTPLFGAQIIEQGTNNGFAQASNAGARRATGRNICFLNPDTEVDARALAPLTNALGRNNVAIAAPQLLTNTGRTQPWCAGCDMNFGELVRANCGVPQSKKIWRAHKTRSADWVSGAALAIDRKIFEDVGGFDENFFLYFEDVDLCRRVREEGHAVLFVPESRVVHHGGHSSQSRQKQKSHYYASQHHYFTKHYGSRYASLMRLLRAAHALARPHAYHS